MSNLNRVWIPSPCYNSRYGSGVRLLVLHTAEGARTYRDLGAYFQNAGNQVSSHVGIDDTLGTVGEYVKRTNAAWTAGNANPEGDQAELCGFASWSTSTWKNQHHNMLVNAAQWLTEEAAKYDLPLVALTPSQAQGGGRGVCHHVDLGSWGGGHTDCGSGFPMSYVLDLAKGGTPQTTEVLEMNHLAFDTDGTSTIVIPKEYRGGDYELVFACSKSSEIEVDKPGFSDDSLILSYDAKAQSTAINDGLKMAVVRRATGTAPIAFSFQHK